MQNMVFTLAMTNLTTGNFPQTSFANLAGFALDTQSVFNLGLFHGLVFSLPFSPPILICIYRFLVEGVIAGSLATLGTIFGQICFLFFILGNFRSTIQFWYSIEPFLAVLGFAITFKIAADFWAFGGTQFGTAENSRLGSFTLFGGTRNPQKMLFLFGLNFLLMFLNPAMPASSSRIVLASPVLTGLTEGFQLTTAYNFGFLITASLCISLIWPFVVLFALQLVNRGTALIRFAGTNLLGGFAPRSATVRGTNENSSDFNRFDGRGITPRFLTFLIVGCVISGALQYSWRLFTQYPVEAVLSQPGLSFSAREFPSFDSNIRHRDKNLPVDRHTPIEKMNARRTLSGRPPLSEEQKSDAYFKFNSFFVNGLEQKFENTLIARRTGVGSDIESRSNQKPSLLRTYDEVEYLQKLKQQWEQSSNESFGGGRLLQNNTKGKPKFSYIRTLIDEKAAGDGSGPNPLLHDELQIYGALLAS